jgi:hypothetical protein
VTRGLHHFSGVGTLAFLILAALVALAALPTIASADETVLVCDIYGNHVAPAPPWIYGIRAGSRCPGNAGARDPGGDRAPGGLAIWTLAHTAVRGGAKLQWTLRAPRGFAITSVYVPHMYSQGLNDGDGWAGGFSWSGGSGGVATFDREGSWGSTSAGRPRFVWPSRGTRFFAWRLVCRKARCRNGGRQWLSVELLELHAREIRGPHLVSKTGLWQARGWIRGSWRLSFSGDSPSGLCGLSATLNGRSGPGAISNPNPAMWHQCSAAAVNQVIDTARYGQGTMPLTIGAVDAAGESVSRTRTIKVDNIRPTVSLSGPTDAPSSAGTQYIKGTASAGPSGVAGIVCSLDLAPPRLLSAATLEIPVRGVGIHHLSCYSESNARDEAGTPATSASASWTLTIRSPSASTLSFVRVGDALHCARDRESVWIPAHWTIRDRHGHRARVKVPAQHREVEVVHCHLRTTVQRVRQDGRWTTLRVVHLPHRVAVDDLEVGFGSRPVVSGWLGRPNGDALGAQLVRILTAPDNGSGKFTQAAVARTAPDGVWNAQLPAGPSRVVVAVYGGGSTLEPSFSQPAHLAVKASVSLHVHPHVTHWGDTIRLSGRLRGGYIPAGGEVVFIRIGWRGGSTEIRYVYTRRNGEFSTSYTFSNRNATANYTLWGTSGREADYPYAPGTSNRVRVKVEP